MSYNGRCVCANPNNVYFPGVGCIPGSGSGAVTSAPPACATCCAVTQAPSTCTTTPAPTTPCSNGVILPTLTCTAATTAQTLCYGACSTIGSLISQASQAACQRVCNQACLAIACPVPCCTPPPLDGGVVCKVGRLVGNIVNTTLCLAATALENTCFGGCNATAVAGGLKALCQGVCKAACLVIGCDDCCPNVASGESFVCQAGALFGATISGPACTLATAVQNTCYTTTCAGMTGITLTACQFGCQLVCLAIGCNVCCPNPPDVPPPTFNCGGLVNAIVLSDLCTTYKLAKRVCYQAVGAIPAACDAACLALCPNGGPCCVYP